MKLSTVRNFALTFVLVLLCGLLDRVDSFTTAVSPSTLSTSCGVSSWGGHNNLGASGRFGVSKSALHGKKAARAAGNDSSKRKERVKKPKDDVLEIEATVLESLPNAMFRCAIDGAPETQEPVLATISGKIRKNYVKILVGDRVLIELSPYDLTRGRITFRYR